MQTLPMANANTPNTDVNADAALLARTRVATPCPAQWASMIGDDRSRFCPSCRKNVYNLSAMTAPEAAALVREKEGKLCARYYTRADGTMITQDCPVGIALVKRRVARAFAAGIVGFAAIFSAVTSWWKTDTGSNLLTERAQYWAEKIAPPAPIAAPPEQTLGVMLPVEPLTGKIAPQEPPTEAIMGDVIDILPKPREMSGRVFVSPPEPR